MSNTKIKAGQFSGIVGHGVDGYFLKTNGDGTMAWAEGGASGPSVTSVDYPGDDLAADPAGNQSVILTGTGFATSGMTVTIGGTTAPAVAHNSTTQLTITTPAKAAGDYDIVVTVGATGASGTFVNGISYNGVPTWTTATGSLGTLESETTISTITLAATEPDGGTITFNITSGALPSGLSLTGANIDGTTTAESSTTLYSFTVEAIDNENQSTPRAFSITVNSAALVPTDNFTINTYTGTGSAQAIEGKIGTAASFNGSSSKIVLPTDTFDTIKSNGAFAVSAWFNTSTTGTRQFIFSASQASYLFLEVTTGNQLKGTVSNSVGTNTELTVSTTVTDGYWHHAVFTGDNGSLALYLDNGTPQTGSWNGTFYGGTGGIGIGIRMASSNYWNGKIDQVRLFDKEITSTEVATLYAESNSSSSISTTDIFDDGSGVALYEFENGGKDTGGASGKIGGSAHFNGSSSFIDLNLKNQFKGTVSIWFNGGTPSAQCFLYASTAGSSGSKGIALLPQTNGTIRVLIGQGTSGTFALDIYTTDTFFDSNWHNAVLTWDLSSSGDNVYLYVDNVVKAQGPATTGNWTTGQDSTSNLILGHFSNAGGSQTFNGKIDQVRIINKVISSAERTTLYGETYASATKSTTDIFSDGSGIALYELNVNSLSSNFKKGAVFNGSSSVITTNSDFSGSTATGATISFWFKTSNTSGQTILGSQTGSPSSHAYGSHIYLGNSFSAFSDESIAFINERSGYTESFLTREGSTAYADGNWHHAVFISTNSTKQIWIDGVSKTVYYYQSGSATAQADLIDIEFGTAKAGNFYNGILDQVRIYSTALSSSDVTKLYNESSQIPTANLTAHYKLNGDAKDSAGSYDGTESNIAYAGGTYSGTDTDISYAFDGTPTNVGFVGMAFSPDLVWIKSRSNSAYWNTIFDSVRGPLKRIFTNEINAETTTANTLTSFDSNGFTLGNQAGQNANTETYVAWCLKAGGAASLNQDGNIDSQVSANVDAGFSIATFTGSGVINVGHGLSQTPELIIRRRLNINDTWAVYSSATGTGKYLRLNEDQEVNINSAVYSAVNSTTYTSDWSSTTYNFISYHFHSVAGYQSIGTFDGTGTTSGNIVTTGFRPRFLMWKSTISSGNWNIVDSTRSPLTSKRNYLYADLSQGEDVTSYDIVEFNDTSFQMKQQYTNAGSETYIYLAIA